MSNQVKTDTNIAIAIPPIGAVSLPSYAYQQSFSGSSQARFDQSDRREPTADGRLLREALNNLSIL